MLLDNKVAFITGAGSGIGKHSARVMAAEGAKVALLSRSETELLETAKEIHELGGETLVIPADVSQPESMQAAVAQIMNRWNRMDIVFANAGVNGVWAPLDELTPEEFDRTLAINLKGTFLTIKYSLDGLKKRGGSVIVCSSVNGTRIFSSTGATAYSCSKGAQVVLTKMLAVELAKYKIRVNAVCPGAVETEIDENTEKRDLEREQIPVKYPKGQIPLTGDQPANADQVAQLVLFLASEQSNHITGTEVWIDGGQSLLQG